MMAVVVWVSAVLAADPNEERGYPNPVKIEMIGKDPGLIILNNLDENAKITIRAPRSIWQQLEKNSGFVRSWVDLTGLENGEYILPVRTQVRISPSQIISVEPGEISIKLETLLVKEFTIDVIAEGDPTLGYRLGQARSDPARATVSGPISLVSQVDAVQALLDVDGVSETVKRNVNLRAVDSNGVIISGVSISPPYSSATQDIALLGGYRNVVVKVESTSQVADGFWLTNISVTPPNVTVFSQDPQLVNELPGFVETDLVDLTGLSDDVDIRVTLNLPEGVELAGEESVLVRLSIAALEGSLPITLPLEVIGLPPDLKATLSPDTVDLLITGPMPLLNNLKPGGIRVSINLAGFTPGVHQVTPIVDLLPNHVQVASILPESVEVIIAVSSSELTVTPGIIQTTITPTP